MGLQQVIRWLLPKEDRFYDLLEQQATVLHEGTRQLMSLGTGDAKANDVLTRVRDIEHKGDDLVRQIETALATTFVTPIDREDIHLLASRLDDALDFTFAAVWTFVEYATDPSWTEPMQKLAGCLVKISAELARVVPLLRKHAYTEIIAAKGAISAAEKEADAVYRSTLGALFRNPETDVRDILRAREVLDDLEAAVDRCEDAFDIISHLAIKNA